MQEWEAMGEADGVGTMWSTKELKGAQSEAGPHPGCEPKIQNQKQESFWTAFGFQDSNYAYLWLIMSTIYRNLSMLCEEF